MKENYTLNDRKMRLIGIPLLSVLIPVIVNLIHGESRFTVLFIYNIMISAAITFSLWEGNRLIIIKMRRVFPDYSQTDRRLLMEAVLALAYTFVVTFILDEVLCKILLKSKGTLIGFSISIIPTILVYLVYEAVYFFEAWKANVRKTESLMRESVQSQLEVLKNQLDPHFLFNSMNTLAALIDDENTDAQDYLERLSDVYRYVLVSRNKDTVLVEEELAFVDAYVYLNKIRFRDNLLVEKQLSSATYQQHVTPLSLQMLIENAIKHNVASKENPLKIVIREENGQYLVIANNILEKTVLEKSTRVGLQNIINRYSLLTERRVEILRSDNVFTVKIPLLGTMA
ncbi:sensor histidine kinase [Dyadobacter sp. CY326]|uniref:sensor histidine kinase n=1 Tax=Dyadobacter sp. CY326 TaxID=2907300 RepID=UPI001F1F55C6|nr:histidine kinase [Dyadobacter sp. CY326]MCE7064612.1 histidine kinase [Dyadobacter sp. CY326]